MYNDLIFTTYKNNFDSLPPVKQFHFLSRVELFMPNMWSHKEIASLQEWFLGGFNKYAYAEKLKMLASHTPDPLHTNASELRMPLFVKYPWLYGYELQLFHVLHADTYYNHDLIPLLDEPDDLVSNLEAIAQNPRELAVLSTYAVDVFYLYNRFVIKDDMALIPLEIIDAALDIPLDPAFKIQLNIYLLTHCIIGETIFYRREIPSKHSDYYHKLVQRLMEITSSNWDLLTIDNKLEVALCLNLTKTTSKIIQNALHEAEEHYDQQLGFITDPKMPHKNTLEWAEHRNMLYLLVCKRD